MFYCHASSELTLEPQEEAERLSPPSQLLTGLQLRRLERAKKPVK